MLPAPTSRRYGAEPFSSQLWKLEALAHCSTPLASTTEAPGYWMKPARFPGSTASLVPVALGSRWQLTWVGSARLPVIGPVASPVSVAVTQPLVSPG